MALEHFRLFVSAAVACCVAPLLFADSAAGETYDNPSFDVTCTSSPCTVVCNEANRCQGITIDCNGQFPCEVNCIHDGLKKGEYVCYQTKVLCDKSKGSSDDGRCTFNCVHKTDYNRRRLRLNDDAGFGRRLAAKYVACYQVQMECIGSGRCDLNCKEAANLDKDNEYGTTCYGADFKCGSDDSSGPDICSIDCENAKLDSKSAVCKNAVISKCGQRGTACYCDAATRGLNLNGDGKCVTETDPPTHMPTASPTEPPTRRPTERPTTRKPTRLPTSKPTPSPTDEPLTAQPTEEDEVLTNFPTTSDDEDKTSSFPIGALLGSIGGCLVIVVGIYAFKKRIDDESDFSQEDDGKNTTTVQMSEVNAIIASAVAGTSSWEIPFRRLERGKKIGAGGCGQVYCGRYGNRKVAIKELFATLMNPGDLDEFKKEAALLASVRHPNIVQFFGVSQTDESFFIVTEFCPTSLDKLLKAGGRKVNVKKVVRWCAQIADGVLFLHDRKIVHRDLKPHNLLLGNDGNVRICDFGIAKTVNSFGKNGSSAQMTVQIGSPAYMAPELLDTAAAEEEEDGPRQKIKVMKKSIAFKCDVYSFACVCAALFGGAHIYENMSAMRVIVGVSQNKLRPKIPKECPEEIAALMRVCWQHDPTLRPAFEEINRLFGALKEKYR